MKTKVSAHIYIVFSAIFILLNLPVLSQNENGNSELDKKVKAFFADNRYSWRDMNVPATDGQLLYDIIVENGYKNAVEIGTSTGHSGVWIAWALSKTGGKLVTLEIDERRHKEALANFKKAGVADFVEARLCDAHKEVPQLEEPIDFVFSDADKGWYKNYFIDIAPKMKVGGCFTAHNVTQNRGMYGIPEFVKYIESLSNFKTTYNYEGGGVSISYKTSKN